MQLDRGISNMSSTTGMEDLGTDLHHWRRGAIIIFVSPEMGTRRPVDSQLKGTTFGVNMNHIGNMCSASGVSQQDASGNTYVGLAVDKANRSRWRICNGEGQRSRIGLRSLSVALSVMSSIEEIDVPRRDPESCTHG